MLGRRRILTRIFSLRFLTALSFFHFSGLNNGFTYMALHTQGIPQLGFAPVFVRSLCSAANPFLWGNVLEPRGLKKILFLSGNALQFSSRSAIRKYHPRTLRSAFSFRIALSEKERPAKKTI